MSPSRPFILRPVATSLLMVAIVLAGPGMAPGRVRGSAQGVPRRAPRAAERSLSQMFTSPEAR
jgi:F0F1-type ATP synthase membrane subunit c/vacuolar-type H+-ATPase subunit K